MRRKVFESSSEADLEEVFAKALIGELGLVDPDGYARIVPVNFVYAQRAIYFHGALAGEKHELMRSNPKATFLAYVPYSPLPSTVMGKDGSACPASILYRSAFVRGRGSIVESTDEKALGLQKMMEKNQPEGGYLDFPSNLDFYKDELKAVAVFKVTVESFAVKNKLVQNRGPEQKADILAFLEKRATPLDLEVAERIRQELAKGSST
jgi:nitroimidazol reductase NimA-like FMN-containing flavoprotein (pyridoxamine 5'-phosphate oxidase superfamily)